MYKQLLYILILYIIIINKNINARRQDHRRDRNRDKLGDEQDTDLSLWINEQQLKVLSGNVLSINKN